MKQIISPMNSRKISLDLRYLIYLKNKYTLIQTCILLENLSNDKIIINSDQIYKKKFIYNTKFYIKIIVSEEFRFLEYLLNMDTVVHIVIMDTVNLGN